MRHIALFCKPGATIVDVTGGTGTTACAAAYLKAKVKGQHRPFTTFIFERDETQFEEMQKRLESWTPILDNRVGAQSHHSEYGLADNGSEVIDHFNANYKQT